MFIDAFLGFNEVQLAKFRIDYLSEFIDRTIVLESKLTHSGIQKPLFFKEWIRTEMNLNEKVEIIEVDLSQIEGVWQRERFSRRYLYEYIISKYPNSRFILSDCDEIPSKEQMKELQTKDTYMKFSTITYFRRANFRVAGGRNENWNRGIYGLTSLPQIADGGRFTKLPTSFSHSPGGHFSYLNYSHDHIQVKIESFGHQELNYETIKSADFVKFCDKYSLNHIGGARTSGFGLLHVSRIEDLTPIQKSLYEFEPTFFDFRRTNSHLAHRILGSLVVSTIFNDQRSRRVVFDFFVMRKKNHVIWPIFAVLIETLKVLLCQIRRFLLRNFFRKHLASKNLVTQ